jgi:hypothetical protein
MALEGFLSNISSQIGDMDGEGKAQLAMTVAKILPAVIGIGQSNKAKKKQAEYLAEMKTIKESRQAPMNPYANVTNPYANMQVATKAAEMQSEQADIALANTLDALRETGAGGATALAQAALKSKQGVSAEIQKQEVKNQQLVAQGEQKMQQLKAVGANLAFQAQEKRDLTDLDRLQYGADLEAQRRASSFSSGVGSLSSMAPGLAKAFINPGDGGNEVNIGSGFDDSQLYNNSDQAMEAFEKADLDTMIESDIPFGGLPD